MADAPKTAADVDAALAALPPERRAALQALRERLRALAPDAVETISYGVPAFKLHGRSFVAYGAGRKGDVLSFYVQSPAVLDAHADLLHGRSVEKGTVHFTPDAPLPDDLLETLVRARRAEVEALGTKKR